MISLCYFSHDKYNFILQTLCFSALIFVFYFLISSGFDQAVEVFMKLRDIDPYRLENMDIFSNILFVKVSYLYHKLC